MASGPNMSIFRYAMKDGNDCTFDVPEEARILKVAGQPDHDDKSLHYPTIWMLVDRSTRVLKRRFLAIHTGDPLPPKLIQDPIVQYKGTALCHGGSYVYHVFEVAT